jgi:hypothetical protein
LAAIGASLVLGTTAGASDAETRCSDSVGRTAHQNATQLFDAARTCGAEKRPLEATLLMIEGQIRAIADMDLFAPKTDQDQLQAASSGAESV